MQICKASLTTSHQLAKSGGKLSAGTFGIVVDPGASATNQTAERGKHRQKSENIITTRFQTELSAKRSLGNNKPRSPRHPSCNRASPLENTGKTLSNPKPTLRKTLEVAPCKLMKCLLEVWGHKSRQQILLQSEGSALGHLASLRSVCSAASGSSLLTAGEIVTLRAHVFPLIV